MKRFLALLSLATLATASWGQAQTLENLAAARGLTDKVLARVAGGDFEGGLRMLKPYSIVPDAEIESAIGQAKLQVPLMEGRFGRSVGAEFLREERVGDSLARITQIQRFEKHAMRWIFVFYRGPRGWVMNTFYFDDKILSVFPN
jgi:hypothetical protein